MNAPVARAWQSLSVFAFVSAICSEDDHGQSEGMAALRLLWLIKQVHLPAAVEREPVAA